MMINRNNKCGSMIKLFKNIFNKDEVKQNKGKISEWSYQRFSSFYDTITLPDKDFDIKINTIINCIKNRKMENIDEIAKKSNCTFEECAMKIKYLKNKRVLEDYYIDRINRLIKKCSPEDQKKLEKYYTMIYFNHYQIDEMAIRMPNLYKIDIKDIENEVFNDIKYLYDKSIINGIKLDEEKRKIIYYSVEKHKKSLFYTTINCPKCGALVDVCRGGNGRCDYCNSIVEDEY